MQSKRIIFIALVVGALLLVPYFMMQFNIQLYDPGSGYESLNWNLFDFVVMGILLFGTGLVLDFVIRKTGKHKALAIVAVVLAFFLIWAELAVGIFGSPLAGS